MTPTQKFNLGIYSIMVTGVVAVTWITRKVVTGR